MGFLVNQNLSLNPTESMTSVSPSPMTDGMPEKGGRKGLQVRVRPAVHVNFTPAPRPADQYQDALSVGILDEIDAVRCIEGAWPPITRASWMRVVKAEVGLPRQE